MGPGWAHNEARPAPSQTAAAGRAARTPVLECPKTAVPDG
jgi:hypothetical protein